MLAFSDELKQRPIAFLKFSDKLWKLESLQKGTIYMNTLRFFKELEEKAKEKGMGDKNEGSIILTELNLKFYDYETKELVYEGPARRSAITMEEDLQKLVFCMSYLDFGSLNIIEEGMDFVKAMFSFSGEQKKNFVESFGKYVMVISCSDFINSVRATFEKENIAWVGDKVKYSDFSINYMDRLEDYMNNRSGKYFWKDKFFEKLKNKRNIE
ncbi:MAG: hypothetical protein AVO34_11625 [Firmicutes bacterium ML8_F2]|jgi:hypothetical protein|nr:MAG: hypothetical protein AVO34_11625 [Firmicutes bacterium ML8_F2]